MSIILFGLCASVIVLYTLLRKKRRRLQHREKKILTGALADLGIPSSEDVVLLALHYTDSVYKTIDAILSGRPANRRHLVVVFDGPLWLVQLKAKSWSGCTRVIPMHTPETSGWNGLMRGSSELLHWNGRELKRYSEIELFLEKDEKNFSLKEGAS
ncbi:hypothetical protein [Paenibacillus chitinolyticus]|uniref:hypothetical protein n=1 Tax=Paenibacillus chitinolyticus TaxID=79263 RepID=UPI001C436AF5|nr:hypothetical protein [Paenibacillus chitinolyticus]MBV6717319.1 hypothetical protein [Paenibacillus chitinolyticus]